MNCTHHLSFSWRTRISRQFSGNPTLMLGAIWHFDILFIATTPPEAQLSTCLDSLLWPCDKKVAADIAVCEDCNSPDVRWYITKHSKRCVLYAKVWWLDSQFHWKRLQQLFVLCEQQSSVHSYFTDHVSSPRPPLPPLFSLTIPKKTTCRNRSQKSLLNEHKHV